jgi:hypothetical protein
MCGKANKQKKVHAHKWSYQRDLWNQHGNYALTLTQNNTTCQGKMKTPYEHHDDKLT